MLDKDKNYYKEFLEKLGIEDKYGDYEKFIQGFLYSEDSFSINSAFSCSYDNALVLRHTIGSESLAYIDLAWRIFKSSRDAKNLRLALIPVIDYILAFWGCIDDKLNSADARNIIKCGKFIDRLDVYFRFSRDYDVISGEFEKMCHVVKRMRKGSYNTQELSDLVEILSKKDNYKERLKEALVPLNKLFEEF
jgi:hypothetical protein